MLPRIYLIRHGETAWSISGQHTGRTDIPLTTHGEDAARELGQRLRGISFSRVLTSPLQRARRTCELVGLGPVAAIEPDLAEWDYGDYEGQRTGEILAARPDWNLFRDGCPHGESPAQISDRADRLIARLRAQEGEVALFSHGHFGRVLGLRWIGLPAASAQYFLLGTASISILDHDHSHTDRSVIALWNAAARELFCPASEPPASDGRLLKRRAIQRWENEGGEIPQALSRPEIPGIGSSGG